MLIFESKYKPGIPYTCSDFGARSYYKMNGEFPTITKIREDQPFGKVTAGNRSFPQDYTVKRAMRELVEEGGIYNSSEPNFVAWLNDMTNDAGPGEEILSWNGEVIYRLRVKETP